MATATQNQMVKSEAQQLATLRTALEAAAPRLAEVAPKHLKVERLVRLLLSAGSRNPKILKCSQASVLQFAMKCSETGLEPIGPGGAWPIPFENRKNGTVELQFIPDYRGLVNCAKWSGCIKDAWAEVVRAEDEFEYELGLNASLVHRPARGPRGALESVYCVIVFLDDTKRFVVMDAEEIRAIRGRSRVGSSGPWVTDEAEMWKKTVIRRAMKPFAGASQSLDTAIEAEDAANRQVEAEAVPMPCALAAGEVEPSPIATQEPTQELLFNIQDGLDASKTKKELSDGPGVIMTRNREELEKSGQWNALLTSFQKRFAELPAEAAVSESTPRK